MSVRTFVTVVMFGLLVASRVFAHHSFAAEFDASKALRITGTLVKVEWTNPHTYFYVDVSQENGEVVRWTCESAAPGALSRRGFKRAFLKLGETLIIDGYRAKNGANLIDAQRVTLPDGRILAGASASDSPVAPPTSR